MGDGFYGGTPPWPQTPPPPPRMTAAAIAPVPKSCEIPPVSLPHTFELPRKRITSPADLDHLHSSRTGHEFLGFIVALSESVINRKISDPCSESPPLKSLLRLLDTLAAWAEDIPPAPQPGRYGNPAFRLWHERLRPEILSDLIPAAVIPSLPGGVRAADEIFPYFADSFGNATRIDYGTGHEANFAAFLLCLVKLGVFGPEDYTALVTRGFARYLGLMRGLQLRYWLEPAGSHGVWGLDDYHFLPFIFGAAQLVGHKHMRPKSVLNEDILENFSDEYMYLGCVRFVKQVKKGPLAEHSPMIDDISGVPNWGKVHTGMLKMYRAEVLQKVPIMQHFLFGSLISW